MKSAEVKALMCIACGCIDEEETVPDHGLVAGAQADEFPDSCKCPECGAIKRDFETAEG